MDSYFKNNRGKFDLYEPKPGHTGRFIAKLENRKSRVKRFSSAVKWLVAASVVLSVGLGVTYWQHQRLQATPDEKVRQSRQYFSMILQEEIRRVQNETTEETAPVFDDAMKQIKLLERDYQKLEKDYRINRDKFILNAMIENFQQRIEVLRFVQKQMKKIEQTKNEKNEKNRA